MDRRLHELREVFLSAQESQATRVLAIGLSVTLVMVVLWLVRRHRLREEYTPIWVCTALGMFVVSVRADVLHGLTRLLGAWTPSSAIFFLADLFLLAICLNYAVRLSKASLQLKNLAQEVALLRGELDRLDPERADAADR